jgi:glutamate synthase domain-containing protein 3
VVVLGRTGRNFGAGMSGGVTFVLDVDGRFRQRCNPQMIDVDALTDADDLALVHGLLARHVELTASEYATRLLRTWTDTAHRFVRVIPRDYKRVLQIERRGHLAEPAELVEGVHG